MTTEDLDQALAKPRLLAALENQCAPLRRQRQPYWTAPMPPIATGKTGAYRKVIPSWNWTSPDWAQHLPEARVVMDANAAWLSAASAVRIGHGALTVHRVGNDCQFTGEPGYYLMKVYAESWTDTRLPHPLGPNPVGANWDGFVWVTHHTLDLIRWLHAQDAWWGVPTIHESWTAEHAVNLQSWTQYVNGLRAVAMTRGDKAALDRIKIAYAQAIQMMPGHEKAKIKRPDWYDAVLSRHSAETFRKMYRAREAHVIPLRMHAIDSVVFTRDDFHKLLGMEKRPFRVDQSGLTLGAFKWKANLRPGEEEAVEL